MFGRNRRRAAAVSTAALMAALSTSHAAFAQEAAVRFTVPAQPLAAGLLSLGREAHLSIAAPTLLVAGKTGRAVEGEFTVRAALTRMLDGTGLGYEFVGPNAVRIVEGPRSKAGDAGETSPAQAAAEVAQLSELVVAGTRIRGQAPVGSELVNLSRDDIEQLGRATVTELVKTIPQVQSLGATDGLNGHRGQGGVDNQTAATSVNLRGLGADATLVLVNGRRVAPTASGAFVDVSQIPLSAVQRMELLPDGASAIYGSDAVGGVVNFVLRKGREGAESSLRYGLGSGFHEYDVGQSLGFDWGSGSALLAYEYYSRTRLAASKRDYFQSDLRAFGGTDYRDPYTSNPGNILAGGVLYAIPKGQDGTHLTPAALIPGAPNLMNAQRDADILPSQSRNSFVASISQDLTPSVHLYLDALYATRDFEKRLGAPGGANTALTVPNTNPFFVSPIPGATSTTIYYSLVDDLPQRVTGSSKNYTVTAGARFDLPREWTLEAYGSLGQDRASNLDTGGANNFRLAQALADPNPATAFNPFGDGSHTSAATLAKIAGSIRYRNTYDVRVASLGASGPLFSLPGGDVRAAVGTDYRYERLDAFSLLDYDQPTPYSLPSDGATHRDIVAGYAEVLVPVFGAPNARPGLQRLDLSFAIRSERYSDFGSTTNPKFGLVWKPFDSLSLRGSWGTSFKAPRLVQLNEGQNAWLYRPFPNANAQPGPTTPVPGYSNTLLLFGPSNKNLKPETAETWSVGADFHAAAWPGFKAGLTYFSVRYKDRISAPTVEQVSALLAQGSVVNDLVLVRHPTQAQVDAIYSQPNFIGLPLPANQIEAILNLAVANFGAVEEEGLDVNASYQFGLGRGQVTLDGGLTYLTKYSVQRVPGDPFVDQLNTFSNPNRLHGHVGAAWRRGPVQAALGVNYLGGYDNNLLPVTSKVSSWTTVDPHLGYTFPDAGGLRRGVSLILDVENLFDSDPPFVDNEDSKIGYDPEQGDPRGRTVSLTLRKTW